MNKIDMIKDIITNEYNSIMRKMPDDIRDLTSNVHKLYSACEVTRIEFNSIYNFIVEEIDSNKAIVTVMDYNGSKFGEFEFYLQ